ncbi:choline dehydrogenase-like flavoprotein [Thiogranum longum]|uniref:Choline dehydrogenase-like flavoprotein n=1 Tax=Thiogranum longum TaxID=1537524 RepID=A0A4R1HLU4_9GAMM|nr:GMC family oxidoreductase [Thiogranum longum]TCK18182.1 choline dehydrogenase-like flavoprotein [Thiogranum longum]
MADNTVKIDALDTTEPFDVCIIGSGPTGTIIGKTLVENGIRTVILEAGSSMFNWLTDSQIKQYADFESTGNTNYPEKHTKASLLGGTANFWTGRCERLHPSDMEPHAYTPPENPWPITYDDLDPYYEKAERIMRVRGNSQRSKYSPPRKTPLPLPQTKDISFLTELLDSIGVEVDDSPTAIPQKSIRFFKVQKEILPGFAASPNLTLVTGAIVRRLVSNADKNIVGAEVQSFEGEKKVVRARIYVLAAGGIGAPRLLLMSKSEHHPEGIGNTYDRVGRGFNEHPAVNFYAQIPHQRKTIYPLSKIARTHQFYSTYREEGLGSIMPVFRQSWILPHHNMPLKISKIPHNMLAIAQRLLHATLYMGVVIEMKISDSNRVTLSTKKKDPFGDPLARVHMDYADEDIALLERSRELVRDLYAKVGAGNIYEDQITFSRHLQGTCRMGTDPKTSVVDPDLRAHESPNLYISGSEAFVTGGAMQPTLTIAALASRLSEHLVTRFKEGSVPPAG